LVLLQRNSLHSFAGDILVRNSTASKSVCWQLGFQYIERANTWSWDLHIATQHFRRIQWRPFFVHNWSQTVPKFASVN